MPRRLSPEEEERRERWAEEQIRMGRADSLEGLVEAAMDWMSRERREEGDR